MYIHPKHVAHNQAVHLVDNRVKLSVFHIKELLCLRPTSATWVGEHQLESTPQ